MLIKKHIIWNRNWNCHSLLIAINFFCMGAYAYLLVFVSNYARAYICVCVSVTAIFILEYYYWQIESISFTGKRYYTFPITLAYEEKNNKTINLICVAIRWRNKLNVFCLFFSFLSIFRFSLQVSFGLWIRIHFEKRPNQSTEMVPVEFMFVWYFWSVDCWYWTTNGMKRLTLWKHI